MVNCCFTFFLLLLFFIAKFDFEQLFCSNFFLAARIVSNLIPEWTTHLEQSNDVHFTQVWVRRSCEKPGWMSTNQPRMVLGHRNCSNGWRKYMSWGTSMNRRYDKHGWYHCNHPEHGRKQFMQQPIRPAMFEVSNRCSVHLLQAA